MTKLFWGPHTCAIGIHVLLEEVGATYETERLDVSGGATGEPWFLAINPKGKVPTLVRDDGSVLTEFGAIATWIARSFPDSRLIPDDPEGEARTAEVLAYVEGTLHGQGFARIFAPRSFGAADVLHEATGFGDASIRREGRRIVEKAFGILDPVVARHDYVGGDRLTIADAALFYAERWAHEQGVTLPVNLQRHLDRMLARPAVHRVRLAWGEEPAPIPAA